MQITQFLVGASFAAAHLFISYDVPVTIPYTITRYISEAVSEAAAVVSSVAAAPIATAKVVGVTNWLKKIALRAAGEEGLAENIIGDEGRPFGAEYGDSPLANVTPEPRKIEEIRYRSEWQTVHCIDTEGQAFAIWLNCFYLMPLTLLFIRFFVRSYSQRRRASIDAAGKRAQSPAVQASKDAAHGVEHHFGKSIEKGVDALVSKISGADTVGERMTEGGMGKARTRPPPAAPGRRDRRTPGSSN